VKLISTCCEELGSEGTSFVERGKLIFFTNKLFMSVKWRVNLCPRDITKRVIRHADHVAPSVRKKLALTSSTSDGRSAGIVCSGTKATEFSIFSCSYNSIKYIIWMSKPRI
jgi:hypothetical protein